jgi:cell wall-associated NlpC family hydrolase
LRARALSTFLGSMTILVTGAPAAVAGGTGGVGPDSSQGVAPSSAGSSASGPSSVGGPVTPTTPPRAAPVTSRAQRLTYRGPVYERTAAGEVVPYQPPPGRGQLSVGSGGSPVGMTASTRPLLLVPGSLARYVHGLAAAPMSAPAAVQEVIWAGDQIIGLPYIYGGGHQSFDSPGYDCSGTVSFALHGAGLLATPEDSSEFMAWGSHGVGRWITIFSNPAHAYVDVAGLRLDTSAADDPSRQQGPRWRPLRSQNSGYTIRHPLGL